MSKDKYPTIILIRDLLGEINNLWQCTHIESNIASVIQPRHFELMKGNPCYIDSLLPKFIDELDTLAMGGDENRTRHAVHSIMRELKRTVKLYNDLKNIIDTINFEKLAEDNLERLTQKLQSPVPPEMADRISRKIFLNDDVLSINWYAHIYISALKCISIIERYIGGEESSRPDTSVVDGEIKQTADSMEMIDSRLQERFTKVEALLTDKTEKWRSGNDKIGCAAFCELLFEKKYFVNAGSDRVVKSKTFAKVRYGLDLGSALNLDKNKKGSRNKHKRYFETIFAKVK